MQSKTYPLFFSPLAYASASASAAVTAAAAVAGAMPNASCVAITRGCVRKCLSFGCVLLMAPECVVCGVCEKGCVQIRDKAQ